MMPHFTKIEYLTREGWVVGHAGISLIDPGRYVERLASNGKVGRATDLDTGEVWQPDEIPDVSTLHPVPHSPIPATQCPYCTGSHTDPGTCLL